MDTVLLRYKMDIKSITMKKNYFIYAPFINTQCILMNYLHQKGVEKKITNCYYFSSLVEV